MSSPIIFVAVVYVSND